MSYEQAPTVTKKTKSDGLKRIFVERRPTREERDCQIPRLMKVGYKINDSLSDDTVACMEMPMSAYNKRQKDREIKTTSDLLNAPSAGLPGEFHNTVKLMGKQSMEAFFDAPEDDEDSE